MTPPMQVMHTYEIQDAKGENIAHARVKETPGGLWLTDVWCHADYRQQGKASALIVRVVDDWSARDLYLSVEPYTDRPLDADALAAFYARHGFEATDVPGVMRRRST